MNFDFTQAKNVFETYLDQYDRQNDKIHLKIVHTYGVVDAMQAITSKMDLTPEQQELSLLIALLHDIGRFEQLKRNNSFDDRLIDHAVLGVEILKEQDFIRQFIPVDDFDEQIFTTLLNHHTYTIDPSVEGETLLMTQLIRDADKLDNYRVKEVERFETLFDISQSELESQTITPKIFDDFRHHRLIRHADRQTQLDMWLSYLAFMYDFSFPESLVYIKEKNYLPTLFDRLTLKNPETKVQYEQLRQSALVFIEQGTSL